MAVCETHLDTSGFYYTALDNLMDSLHISSTPNLEPARCNNSFKRHFNSADEDKFFSFCSTIKPCPKSDNVHKDKRSNKSNPQQQQNDATKTPTQSARDTPKRSVTTTRKQKLFQATTESSEEFKPRNRFAKNDKDLSPQSLLLRKAITRFECLQRRQERIALSKKPARTSLRV